jgi:hypothetical protein
MWPPDEVQPCVCPSRGKLSNLYRNYLRIKTSRDRDFPRTLWPTTSSALQTTWESPANESTNIRNVIMTSNSQKCSCKKLLLKCCVCYKTREQLRCLCGGWVTSDQVASTNANKRSKRMYRWQAMHTFSYKYVTDKTYVKFLKLRTEWWEIPGFTFDSPTLALIWTFNKLM